jgi:hypothetical protein
MTKSKTLVLTLGAVIIAAVSAIAAVGSGYTLFGGATYVTPGNNSNTAVKLVSDGTVPSTPPAPYSGIDFAVAAGMKFSDIANLATDYNFTQGSCGIGSPRFVIFVTTPNGPGNIIVYIGPYPSYTSCAAGWTSSGNLVTATSFVDAQGVGGPFYDTFATAQANYGSYPVTDIQLVADAGYAFPTTGQTVQIDNTQINNTTYTYEPPVKDDCKNGGWQNFTSAPGPFKNQGQCVSYFASDGHGNH